MPYVMLQNSFVGPMVPIKMLDWFSPKVKRMKVDHSRCGKNSVSNLYGFFA